MKHILVTGSNGQLGSEIKEISKNYEQLNFFFTDIEELDITNPSEVKLFFSENSVDLIINCAAYTAVDKAESEENQAKLVNIEAVKNLVQEANKNNIKLIHISTDYVFDGNANIPYTENEPTNPQSIYGSTKLEGEKQILHSNIESIIIRTSWLYSSYGGNFVKTMLRLGKEKEELNVVDDQYGSPTYAADLAKVILDIINSKIFIKGIYHYSNEGICSWHEFANEIMHIKGLLCKINRIPTKDYPTDAKRPVYSVLNKSKISEIYKISIPHWKDSLKMCLEVLG